MKEKLYLTAAVLGIGAVIFAGCGNSQDGGNSVNNTESTEISIADTFDYDVNDYVTLGEYKGLEVRYPVPTVSEDDIEMEIEYLLDENIQYNEITDRGAQDGDSMNIDYTATIAGEAYEEGSDENYEFILGEGSFSDDFENNLSGKKAGETFTFKITYPEDYDDEEVAAKDVEYSVTVNSVSETIIPEYNDAFIKEVTDYDTVKDYEAALSEDLMASAQQDAVSTAGEDALKKAVANAAINGYPQALYDACYDSTLEEYQEYADMFGMELSDFIEDEEELNDEVLNWVNEILVSQAIAKQEGFEVTDDNYKADGEELASDYGYESLDDFTADYGEAYVRLDLIKEKAVSFLYDNAKIEEVSEEEYFDAQEGELEGGEELELDTEMLFEDDTE